MYKVKSKIDISVSILVGVIVILSVSGFPSDIFGFMRMSAVFGVSAISLVVGLLLPLIYKRKFEIHRIDIFCWCFLLFYMLDFHHMDGLWNIGALCLLTLFVVIRFLRYISYIAIFKCILGAIIWLTGWGYLQFFECIPSYSIYFSITGPFHNPAVLAIILSLLLGVALNGFIIFYDYLKKHRMLLAGMVLIVIFSISLLILTYARAAYMALLASVLYCLYIKFVFVKQNNIRLFYILGMMILLPIFIGILYILKPQSANGRLLVWKISGKMIQDRPVLGLGKGGFAANYLYYQADYMKSSTSLSEKKLAGSTHLAFNEPLRVTVEYGLVGFFVYLVFVIWTFLPPRKRNAVSVITKSVMVGIVSWSMFAYPDQVFPVLTLLVIAIACYLNKKSENGYGLSMNRLFRKFMIIGLCCAIPFLGERLWVKWKAYHELYTILHSSSSCEIVAQPDVFIRLKKEMIDDIGFAYFYCQLMRKSHQESEYLYVQHLLEQNFPSPGLLLMKGDYLKEKEKWKEAEEAYILAAYMVPTLQTPRAKLAFLYNEIGKKEEALAIAHKLLTEKVKVYDFATFYLHRDLKEIFEDELR
ncbi:O-antigen ligase family protein [Bacteroides oleiciplenus]|uniref:O-antigen ligase family protein n=1 Tax=Bacteroides oleiciplenus TaxID=626931 RepID=UPI0026DB547A|nr:O-antigen ligase family protein [Bacteroides oleiciplenus]